MTFIRRGKNFFAITLVVLAVFTACGNAIAAINFSSDEKFLENLEYHSILYFVRESNPHNCLIKDSSRPGSPASVAAVGFGLTAICIGESRGWIDTEDAKYLVLKTLKTFRDDIPNKHGFYYHFLDMRTGQRAWSSEISSIDTALFLAGALFAGEYFKGTEIEDLARELYERVDWPWMLNGKKILCMGWKPEEGFLPYYWDSYSEAMILYALAIGSPTYPIQPECWLEWKKPVDVYEGYRVVYCSTGSLFTYQYSHAWIDFRSFSDAGEDYFNNSVNATKANKQFCIDNSTEHRTYSENSWGLSACISPEGYRGYGAKPGAGFNDGTIPPCGMAGSIVFDPVGAVNGLKHLYASYGDFLYGIYGFKDAFNADKDWWAEEYLAIDVGITAIMVENHRSGLVWAKFMELPAIKRWLKRVSGLTIKK